MNEAGRCRPKLVWALLLLAGGGLSCGGRVGTGPGGTSAQGGSPSVARGPHEGPSAQGGQSDQDSPNVADGGLGGNALGSAGAAAALAGGATGTNHDIPLCDGPCGLLTSIDGWVPAAGNSLGIQGALFAFADRTSEIGMTTNISGSNACIAGTAARVDLTCTPPPGSDCFGVYFGPGIGLNLNQPIDPITMMPGDPLPYDASGLKGFAFELSGNDLPRPSALRFQVETASQVFCSVQAVKLKAGVNIVLFSDLRTECYFGLDTPSADTAKSEIIRLDWKVVTNTSVTVPFDFCVSNIRALVN